MGGVSFGLESDCINAVNAFVRPKEGCWDWECLMNEIRLMASQLNFRGITFVCREANLLAHCLAQVTMKMGESAF